MNPVLETARLSFRDFTLDDYEAVHAYGGDPEVTRYTAFGPNTPEQTRAFLEVVSGEPAQEDRATYSFALIRKETGQLIGSCGLVRSDRNGPQFSFGYVLRKDCWGQGFASEATTALIGFGFGELGAHRLWAHVFRGNTASEKLVRKLGLRYEGCALQAFYVRNTWFDLQTFAMLRTEWESRRRERAAQPS